MKFNDLLLQVSRKIQKGYIITILACVLATTCYLFLQLLFPYTSFLNGLILTIIISVLVSYPITRIVFIYAENIRRKNEQVRIHNEVKNRLIYILSHDIKSPLSNIQQTLRMIMDASLEREEFLKLASNLSQDISNTLNLTSNIIRWIQVQQKDFKPNIQFLKIKEAITETVDLYIPIAEKKEIKMDISGSGSEGINTDPEMFKIVLRNLLSNAIKFTHPKGRVTVTYTCSPFACSVTVADTGTGIPQEKLDNLFSIHQMMSEKGTLNERGTGIGLHLSKSILDHLEGEIRVKSVSGAGTEFYITLPDIPISNTNHINTPQ